MQKMSVTAKTVKLNATFKNVSSMKVDDSRHGEEEDHFGLYWRAWAVRLNPAPHVPNFLVFGFGCQEFENERDWTVDVEYVFHLAAKDGAKLVQSAKETFKKKDTTYVLFNHVPWDEKEKYMVDDTIKVEYFITIKKVTGFPNFESKEEFSDVFVRVNGEKFCMDPKKLRAAKSPIFDSLLDGNFEKGKKPEIKLPSVYEDHLDNFLDALRGSIDDESVDGALHVAEVYGAKAIIAKCNDYLKYGQVEEYEMVEKEFSKMDLNSGKTDGPPPEAPTSFEKWNELTDKLKNYCIGKMDFKTKYLLRGSSRGERRLVNSQRFKFHELNICDYPSGFYGEFMVEDGGEHYFLKSKDRKNISKTLYPLLAFVLEHADIHWFQSDNFPCVMTPKKLAKFKNEAPYSMRRIMFLGGGSKQEIWLFKRCVKDHIETIEMCHADNEAVFPFDKFMNIPAFATAKLVIINGLRTAGIANKMAKYFIENDAEIGKQLKFCACFIGTLNAFVEEFRNRIVRLIPNQQVQIGMSSQKHIILNLDRIQNFGDFHFEMFVLAVVPPKMSEEECHKYTKYNHFTK